MRRLILVASLVAVSAWAGGHRNNTSSSAASSRSASTPRFGPYPVINPAFTNPFAARGVPFASPYVNPYTYWYTVPYSVPLDAIPAANMTLAEQREARLEAEGIQPQAPAPQVVVFQAPETRVQPAPPPEPAPPPQVVVVQAAPPPAPAPAPEPAQVVAAEPVAKAAEPHTPGPDVYMWTDKDGVTHYSTMVPAEAKPIAKKLATLSP